MDLVRKILTVSAAVVAVLFILAAEVVAMTAAPILAAAVVLVLFAGLFIVKPDQREEYLAALRLLCGEPSLPRERQTSPYAAVRRAGGVRPRTGRTSSADAATHRPSASEPKIGTYEARPEGDEKHEAPPLELRERGLSKLISGEALTAGHTEPGYSAGDLKN